MTPLPNLVRNDLVVIESVNEDRQTGERRDRHNGPVIRFLFTHTNMQKCILKNRNSTLKNWPGEGRSQSHEPGIIKEAVFMTRPRGGFWGDAKKERCKANHTSKFLAANGLVDR